MGPPRILRRTLERNVTPGEDAGNPARSGNRRRFRVFLAAFLVVLLPGLALNLMRPAEYQASARIQITPGGNAPLAQMVPGVSGTLAEIVAPAMVGGMTTGAVLDEAQRLSSRPVLQKVGARLDAAGRVRKAGAGNTADELQRMIGVSPLPGSGVIQLTATGPAPEMLALALNTLIAVYRDELAADHASKDDQELVRARDEVARLEADAAAKRTELQRYRARNGVVSSERDENETLARVKGLTASLNTANEKLAIAESRLRSVRAANESGKGVVQAKDNPTLASLEQRASQTREQLRDMERTYTADFMAMDSQARALRARLAELERQMVETRASSRQAAMAGAEEEVENAKATVARLQQQLAGERQGVQGFLANFSQAKELDNDLTQLEAVRRGAVERLAKLEAGGRGAHPQLGVVESAVVPLSPSQPNYLRDGLFILGGAFVFGLLAMWFTELFNRVAPEPGATAIVLPQPMMFGAEERLANPEAGRFLTQHPQPLGLPAFVLPRELDQDQASALLAAGNREGRIVCALLLLGLGVEEICALSSGDVDHGAGRLHVSGALARDVPLPGWLVALLQAQAVARESAHPVLHDAGGGSLSADDVAALVSAAAHDGGLEGAEEITPEVLRHTCIAWLVRQGVRFSDLAGRVGRLSADQFAAYGRLAPGIPRAAAGLEVPFMPALAGDSLT
ncbi:MAG: tyrosine-type recombinase/integrase [Rhodocyclaceae bacterium]|nr:tyrosine-type recombinase/integrase [Rhodocyclaceae bacterium]